MRHGHGRGFSAAPCRDFLNRDEIAAITRIDGGLLRNTATKTYVI
jgi:hypothetical protein